MDPVDLERLAHARLRQLPRPGAPPTLLPRVMAAVRAAARPWYQREWLSWPAAWQLLSATALVSLVIGIRLLLPDVQSAVAAELWRLASPVASPLAELAASLEAIGTAARIFWRALQPMTGVLLVLVLVMTGASLACAAALGRLTFGGALRS